MACTLYTYCYGRSHAAEKARVLKVFSGARGHKLPGTGVAVSTAMSHAPRDSGPAYGGTCPLCGAQYPDRLPYHLEECPEA